MAEDDDHARLVAIYGKWIDDVDPTSEGYAAMAAGLISPATARDLWFESTEPLRSLRWLVLQDSRIARDAVARMFAQAKRRVRTRYERDLRGHRRRNPPELSQVERDARKQIGDAMMRDLKRFANSGRIPILLDVVHGNPSDASGRARLTRQILPRVV